MALIAPSNRVRRTVFSEGVEAAGVKAYSVYNRMLLPSVFHSMEEDCRHLKSAVQVWDVACERQVQVAGPEAKRLLQFLTPRDLSRLGPERCLYAPMTDQFGGLLNDPVILQVEEDCFWVSIADSDLRFWIQAFAACNGFEEVVTEPDVSPLAVQGPKAEALMARVFGDAVTGLKFFGVGRFSFGVHSMLIARSGYSKQGGFEIYVEGSAYAMPLWNALLEAGRDLDVRVGGPNTIERIEAGLLSYGNDMTQDTSPLEAGLGRFVDDAALEVCFGGRALMEERAAGSVRALRPIAIAADALPPCDRPWLLLAGAEPVGQVGSAAYSPDFGEGVAIGMVAASHWDAGTELSVETQDGTYPARVRAEFWI